MKQPKPRYGVDGVYYVVGLVAVAGLASIAAVIAAVLGHLVVMVVTAVLALAALVPGGLGLRYVWRGKLEQRDRLLALVPWRGDEQILDVGTGAGLLLIGAAKRAPRGHATGIDIWSRQDLSANSKQRTLRNAELEGVAERIEVRDEDARAMTLGDASIDVVVSMLCLHNIEANREHALREIARVVRPGGYVVISDLARVESYARFFEQHGFEVESKGRQPNTFPPQRALVAVRRIERAT